MTELVDLSIAEAGEQLKTGRISSTELVDATLQRIEQTEPVVHAYARVLADSARATAASVDRDLAQGGRWRGPLHGVPIAVKDICFTAGVPTEAGSRVRAGFVPDHDATIVELLHAAGAGSDGRRCSSPRMRHGAAGS